MALLPDQPDITAKELAPVAEKKADTSASTTVDVSEPALPAVKVTADQLEPVEEARPANTLDLDPDPEEEVDTRENKVPVKVAPREPSQPKGKALEKVELAPAPNAAVLTRQRRAVPRPLGSDGFEGASLGQLPEVAQKQEANQALVRFARQAGWAVVALCVAAVLVALFALWW